jgi:hypothetical protein
MAGGGIGRAGCARGLGGRCRRKFGVKVELCRACGWLRHDRFGVQARFRRVAASDGFLCRFAEERQVVMNRMTLRQLERQRESTRFRQGRAMQVLISASLDILGGCLRAGVLYRTVRCRS